MNREVYKHLLNTYGRLPGMWLGIGAEIIRTILLRVIIVLFVAQAASNIAEGNFEAAQMNAVLFTILYIIGIIIGALGELLMVYTEDHEYGRLMTRYYQRLSTKDMSFYRDHQTGYLTSLFRQYLDGILTLVRLIRGDAIRTIISLIAPAVVLCIVNLPIGLVSIAIILVQIVYVFWSSRRVNVYRKQSHEIYREVSGEVSDTLTNIVAFRGAARQDQAMRRMKQLANREVEVFWLRRRLYTVLDIPRLTVTAIGIGLGIFIIAGYRDPAIVGLVVLTFGYMLQIMRNVQDLPNIMTNHDDAITKVHPTLEHLTNDSQKIKDPISASALKITSGRILFSNVGFSYSGSTKNKSVKVFDNLNIDIIGGEHIGIVGLSGAGKSTLASLLMRFDDVTSGAIMIDSLDIRSVKQSDLHSKIAYVPQEPLLFHRSVRENILYFNPEATENEMVAAAKAAHAHDFISKLPDGYETIVGERGVKLSGGQKQRVVIARAILKNAPIFLFDEATSALDSDSEQIIQDALPNIIGQHTAIVIAHRLSTVASLDRIIVMHEGRVLEQGTHNELLENKGQYYRLWAKQTKRDT
jgi:ATP-binding cassette, subfamily B, bacterial